MLSARDPTEVYQCDGFHTYDVIYFIALTITPIYTLLKFDGLVKVSPMAK